MVVVRGRFCSGADGRGLSRPVEEALGGRRMGGFTPSGQWVDEELPPSMEGTMAAANTASQDGRPRDGKHALDMRHRIRAIVSYSDGNQRRNSAYEAEGPGFSGYRHLSWVHLTLHRCTA